MTQLAIETRELTKRFGERIAVDRLSLSVGRGLVYGFLGPNGAGKTTTIGMLLGLVRPTSGQALVFGHDIQRAPGPALAQVGAMIETPAFYPYLSARDNLRVLARAGGLSESRVDPALDVVELRDRARDPVKTFSQGMRQRLAIAAALLPDPQLIMLDEPTNGLDPAGQQEIRELIRTLAAGGRTIFLSGHQLHEIQQICDRVAILKQGQLVAEGAVSELLHHRHGVLVRIQGDQQRAAELLRGVPWVAGVTPHEGALLVDVPPERAAEITTLLTGSGLPVAEIRARDSSLEEVFLELTR
jgi:ABC-2 type transport system ATP-binding protein